MLLGHHAQPSYKCNRGDSDVGIALPFEFVVPDLLSRRLHSCKPQANRLHPVRPVPVSGDRWWRSRLLVSAVDE